MGNPKQNVQNFKNGGLTDTAIKIEPVAVIFNLQNSDIEEFVKNYLSNVLNIEGVLGTRIKVVESARHPEVSVFVFMDIDSPDIINKTANIPEPLRQRMDTGGFKASNKLLKALRPLSRRNDIHLGSSPRDRLVYAQLDIFRVLGMMLNCDRNQHQLKITETVCLKRNNIIITVVKSNRFYDNSNSNSDRLRDVMERIDR